MAGLILCSGDLAKTPYYILGLGMKIYSCEELCFYLCENSYILDRDIMDVKLCQWIEREIGLRKLGGMLYEMLENEKELSEFVTTILRETHYCTEGEIEEIRAILDAQQNIVVMKVSANNAWMAQELEARGLEKSFVLVSNIGMANQQVVRDIDVLKAKIPYLSTLLIKKNYPLQ